MIQIYAMDVSKLLDPAENPGLLERVSENRKQKILNCRQPGARKQSLGAGLLLQHVLKDYGETEADIRIGLFGKPESERICFSLSHSKDMAVCAVAGAAVGCDIEQTGQMSERRIDCLTKRFFSEREQAYLARAPKERKSAEFYRFWTIKESYVKMTGEGLHLPLSALDVGFSKEGVSVRRSGILQDCYVCEYDMEGYHLSVCAEESEFSAGITFCDLPADSPRGYVF